MTITWQSVGAGGNGASTSSVTYPTLGAGDMLIVHASSGISTGATPTLGGSFVSLGSDENTNGTFGLDTGPRRTTAWYKEAVGTESGTQNINLTSGNCLTGSIHHLTSDIESWDVVGVVGNDSTDPEDTSLSITFPTVGVAAGDLILIALTENVDTATLSSEAISATGITFGTITSRVSRAQATGSDQRHIAYTIPVDSGSGSVAITFSWTASTACSAAGVLVRVRDSTGGTQFDVNLSGAASSAGTLARQTGKALAGAATSSAALARQTGKPLAGTSTSSGALTRQTGKALAGALASSGALTTIKAVLRSFAGAMDSAGVLTRQTAKPLSGTADSAGALTRLTGKVFAGTATSSGALSTARVVLLALAGATSSAGALTRHTGRALAGTLASSGALTTAATFRRSLAGAMASSGLLTRQTGKALAGVLTSSGAMSTTRVVLLALSGAMASTGGLVRRTSKTLVGALVSAATLGVSGGSTPTGWAWLLRRSGVSQPASAKLDGTLPTTTDVT